MASSPRPPPPPRAARAPPPPPADRRPTLARSLRYASRPHHTTTSGRLLVDDQGVDPLTGEARAPLEEGQLDQERGPDHGAAQPGDEAERGGHGAAGREEVVDHQHSLARCHRVLVNGQDVAAVLELVLLL